MRSRAGEESFALVSTLLIVAVMALGALAFFQAARMDRLVTRNTADRVRAELAAESGLAMAAAHLQSILTNDTFVITVSATTNPLSSNQLFAGHWQTGAAAGMSYRPLFSALPSATNLTSLRVNTSAQPEITNIPWSANSATSPTVCFTNWSLPGGLRMTSPALYWMAITNTNGVTTARFAFWVEDLSGRLDLSVAGGTGTNAQRPTGTNPAELALWSLFSPGVTNDLSNAVVAALLTNGRSAVPTAASARLASASVTTNLMADLAARLVHDTNEPELVPFGFNYTNQGQPKLNLNQALTNAPAAAINLIVAQISNNLTNFVTRAGGFPDGAYLSSLAANIIDYADTDSQPTFVNVAGSEVRGVEALPFVNERVTFFNLIQTNSATIGGTNGIRLTILTQDFYEFWNPHSKATPAVSLSVVASNSLSFTLGFSPPFNFNNPTAATNSAGIQILSGQTTNTFALPAIPANGFLVTNSLMVTNYFFYPSTNPPPTFPGQYQGNTNFFRYQVYLGSVAPTNLYDRTRVGCFFSANANLPLNTTDTSANRRYFGSYSAFASQTPLGTFRTSTGDSRIMFFLNDNQDQVTYATGSSFGGRNLRGNINVNSNYYQVLISGWPDGGHNSAAGASAGTLVPTAVTPATYSNLPPGVITDAGRFTNIFELGNVHDFIQWRDPTFRTTNGFGSEPNGGQWNILTTNAVADDRFGGGNTLRIGRAEHPRFTNNGVQAAQLLDLFAVSTNAADAIVTNRVAGKINLNTATTNVLRALAAGVVHNRDPALSPGGTNFVVPTNAVNNFIAGVTNLRSTQPFYSPSQLPLTTNGTNTYPLNAVFGMSNTLNVTAWNDAAAEEWFSKIYPLATVRSRNFLVHVVGQAMTTNTNFPSRPLASSRKLFQIHAAPIRNASGLTTNVTVQVVQSWNLQ